MASSQEALSAPRGMATLLRPYGMRTCDSQSTTSVVTAIYMLRLSIQKKKIQTYIELNNKIKDTVINDHSKKNKDKYPYLFEIQNIIY